MKNIKSKKEFLNETIMNIIELSNLSTTLGLEADVILKMLQDEFRNNGDEGVIKTYKEITGVPIEALGKGRYIFKK